MSKRKSIFNFSSKYIQTLYLISCLISLINCVSEAEAKRQVKLIGGMGPGTFAVLLAIIVGIIICIFGLAFSTPGLFVFIGIIIPLLVFIICIALPTKDENEDKKETENTHHDNYVVARWIHFNVMLLFFVGLIAPVFIKMNIDVIPQRVNSNTMKDTFDDKYLEDLEKQKKRKYNLENDSIDDDEKLPLSSNKKKSTFIRLDKDKENNVNKNLLENNLIDDNENNLPIATVKKKDELGENRTKFKKFKRIQNSN